MIRQTHFRPGNIFIENGRMIIAAENIKKEYYPYDPLIIDDNILHSAGFELKGKSYYHKDSSLVLEQAGDSKYKLMVEEDGERRVIREELNAFHELQNYYFADTGKELEYSL